MRVRAEQGAGVIEILGAAGLLAFAVSSISVGVRCTLSGFRNRQLPELAIGLGFLAGVLFGYVPESLATSTDLVPAQLQPALLAVTQVAIRAAALAVMIFTLAVFSRRGATGWAIFTVVSAALLVSWVAFPHYLSQAQGPDDVFWYEVFSVSRSLAVAWGAVESLVYWRMSARRRDLGLSEAAVTNRFLLWGLGLSALTCLMASTTLAGLAGIDPTAYGWVIFESGMGLIGAVSLWLAFFPARAYLQWVDRRAASQRS